MANPSPSTESSSSLLACCQSIQDGPWRLIQLRGKGMPEDWLRERDVDLLGTRKDIDLLVRQVKIWVMEGRCHLRVTCRRQKKVELRLLSLDGTQCLVLDLWIYLTQIDRGRRLISYENALGPIQITESSIQRWPLRIELAVYIHHLVCKKKVLSDPETTERLEVYRARCLTEMESGLADMIETLLETCRIPRKLEGHMLRILEDTFSLQTKSRHRTWVDLWQTIFLMPPRRLRLLSIMGCDGVGKSALIDNLVSQDPDSFRAFKGKHLYRKSLIYKLAVIFIRPLLFQGREKFDETLAFVVYLRACLRLSLFLPRMGQGCLLIDRNILDFLYLERKTDQPRFSRFLGLSQWFGCRIPTIHCVLPYANLQMRKKEMTRQGHCAYDEAMFKQFTERVPTDYTLFYNGGSLEESRIALMQVIRSMFGKS
ncbi:MAG: hypothetical protein P8L18_16800 [Verrucomicrobiota bacterium]|nr:hypothetical protein [Verrucomicrobiota bacterium]